MGLDGYTGRRVALSAYILLAKELLISKAKFILDI